MTISSLIPSPILASKSDKKAILRFYKESHYPARFIGFDTCYLLKKNHNIVASVIISQGPNPQVPQKTVVKSQQEKIENLEHFIPLTEVATEPLTERQYLLHALVVAPHYHRQGYAQTLLKHALTQHQNLVCFAQLSLSSLYLHNEFFLIEDDLVQDHLSPDLLNRLLQYSKKKPDLRVFTTNVIIPRLL